MHVETPTQEHKREECRTYPSHMVRSWENSLSVFQHKQQEEWVTWLYAKMAHTWTATRYTENNNRDFPTKRLSWIMTFVSLNYKTSYRVVFQSWGAVWRRWTRAPIPESLWTVWTYNNAEDKEGSQSWATVWKRRWYGLPVHNSPHGLCGRKATEDKEVRAGELYERGGDMGSSSIIVPTVYVDVKQHWRKWRRHTSGAVKEEVIRAPRP